MIASITHWWGAILPAGPAVGVPPEPRPADSRNHTVMATLNTGDTLLVQNAAQHNSDPNSVDFSFWV